MIDRSATMSLLPASFSRDIWFRDWWDNVFETRLNIGIDIFEGDLIPYFQRRIRRFFSREEVNIPTTIIDDYNKFQVRLDVEGFGADDLVVRVIDDYIQVEGHTEKKEGRSVSSKHFLRRFLLPSGIDMEKITSTFLSNGVLRVNAPKRSSYIPVEKERTIPIHNLKSEKKLTFKRIP